MGHDKVMHHISKKMIMFHHVIVLQILKPKQQNTAICNIIYQFIINQLRMYSRLLSKKCKSFPVLGPNSSDR